jgi:hypothetical protein
VRDRFVREEAWVMLHFAYILADLELIDEEHVDEVYDRLIDPYTL